MLQASHASDPSGLGSGLRHLSTACLWQGQNVQVRSQAHLAVRRCQSGAGSKGGFVGAAWAGAYGVENGGAKVQGQQGGAADGLLRGLSFIRLVLWRQPPQVACMQVVSDMVA